MESAQNGDSSPRTRCPECLGTGMFTGPLTGERRTCRACAGEGYTSPSDHYAPSADDWLTVAYDLLDMGDDWPGAVPLINEFAGATEPISLHAAMCRATRRDEKDG